MFAMACRGAYLPFFVLTAQPKKLRKESRFFMAFDELFLNSTWRFYSKTLVSRKPFKLIPWGEGSGNSQALWIRARANA